MSKSTRINCSRRSALVILAAIAALFLLIGCASLFRAAGYDQERADLEADQVRAQIAAAATDAVRDITRGIAQGQDLKTIAVKTGSTLVWKIGTLAATTIGTLLTGLLAKWLGAERKLTNTIIAGVEDSADHSAKSSIKSAAIAAGIQQKLNRRVQALT